jgi:hypothetical protein
MSYSAYRNLSVCSSTLRHQYLLRWRAGGGAGVDRRTPDQQAVRREGIDADTKLRDVLPLIESNLTIQEVAERLGTSVEAACALVVASLRSNRIGT